MSSTVRHAIPTSEAEHEVLSQIRSLRYGAIEIQVHDGRIVQLERRERQRFEPRRD
ncbi:MAG TPA: YezD family protein [Planctomycetota bacterium]|nr:YezD family protein [Planctomycetota bacterium]